MPIPLAPPIFHSRLAPAAGVQPILQLNNLDELEYGRLTNVNDTFERGKFKYASCYFM